MANSCTWPYATKALVLLLLSLISPLVHCQSSADVLIADGYGGFSACSIYQCLVPLYKNICGEAIDFLCACRRRGLLEAQAQCIASHCSFDEAKQGYHIASEKCAAEGGLGISRSDWMREARADQQGSPSPTRHTPGPTPSQGTGGTTSGSGTGSSGGSSGTGGGSGDGMNTGTLVGIVVASIGSAAGIATLWWAIYTHTAKERRKKQQERAQALKAPLQAEVWHGGPGRGHYAPVYNVRDPQDQWRY